ncbi:GIY-YIG nuclease family protein [Pontibacter sp. BT731]|uniref:GIY-YIG nuclease family protein n=1 Tax=Pontibacter coccineus TaxID=3063328 RepID=UPI0026E4013F|nr:GIY-YIG nuclease family protein [Pontibacter sp. BT731]MDO6392069.1 GIY-YIG nuclease family protein [Pontibacter sp. BT731]
MKFTVPDEYKNASGVYKISSSIDSRVYIGSTVDLFVRYTYHKNHILRWDHINLLLKEYAQEHMDLHLEFSVLEYCDKSLLTEREIHYIREYKAVYAGFGFNVKTNGLGIDRHTCEGTLNTIILPRIKEKLDNPKFDIEAQFCPDCQVWLNSFRRQIRDLEEFRDYYETQMKEAKKRVAELEALTSGKL